MELKFIVGEEKNNMKMQQFMMDVLKLGLGIALGGLIFAAIFFGSVELYFSAF